MTDEGRRGQADRRTSGQMRGMSLLFPDPEEKMRRLSETTIHDLGMDSVIEKLSDKPKEREYIGNVMRLLPSDPHTVQYRCDVFDDLRRDPGMRDQILEILDRIDFLKDHKNVMRDADNEAGAFDLLERMNDIGEYIESIEAIYNCLQKADIRSEGLLALKDHVTDLYTDNGFSGMKKDIAALRADTSDLKSVTLGINLNEAFEAESIGLISINDHPFTKAGIVSNFVDLMKGTGDRIQKGADWKEDYTYYPFDAGRREDIGDRMASSLAAATPLGMATLLTVPDTENQIRSLPWDMNEVADKLLKKTVHHLRSVLNRYSMITITDITGLMPEFIYYVRWAEYIGELEEKGYRFAKPEVIDEGPEMEARGIYNLKLAALDGHNASDIVTNDLDFRTDHQVYILTGANRGGKTTITQAVGQVYFLAQGGVPVPASSFRFFPVDGIYTHFPADEDKTMELGRLGEECKRFREIFEEATGNSLLLLNETFSTTSFEEGFYIARDAVRAMLHKGCRAIYNTHMHKLARDLDEINKGSETYKAASLVMESRDSVRSYHVKIAPPEGLSYARDIAEKYGVTCEALMEAGDR